MATHADLLDAGLTPRQAEHWNRKGYLRPDTSNPGTGRQRTFTRAELAVAATMARLVAAGITVATAEQVARADTQPVEIAPGITIEIRTVP